MAALAGAAIMLAMTRPVTSSRVVLIADRRPVPPDSEPAPVRRYRIARLRFDNRPAEPESRFEHLKRVYD